jgi:serine/threonine protein kinase
MSLKALCEKMEAAKLEPFSVGHLLSILGDISTGMQFIHSRDIAHRDMHLKNFLICDDFTVKVRRKERRGEGEKERRKEGGKERRRGKEAVPPFPRYCSSGHAS